MVPVHKIETFRGAWDFFGPINGTSDSEGHFGAKFPWENYLEGGGSEEIIKSTRFCKVHYVLNSDIKEGIKWFSAVLSRKIFSGIYWITEYRDKSKLGSRDVLTKDLLSIGDETSRDVLFDRTKTGSGRVELTWYVDVAINLLLLSIWHLNCMTYLRYICIEMSSLLTRILCVPNHSFKILDKCYKINFQNTVEICYTSTWTV
jgi:hypothetical protein